MKALWKYWGHSISHIKKTHFNMSKINALSVPWVLDIRIVSFLVIYLKNNNFSQMVNWQNASFFFFSISFTKCISMVLKNVFLKYILKMLIFKKAFFKTDYSNIPLLKKKAQIYLGKKKIIPYTTAAIFNLQLSICLHNLPICHSQ